MKILVHLSISSSSQETWEDQAVKLPGFYKFKNKAAGVVQALNDKDEVLDFFVPDSYLIPKKKLKSNPNRLKTKFTVIEVTRPGDPIEVESPYPRRTS